MRLVCPNCDAEYEVDVAIIPVDGRDVQCSNCGHAWYQASPDVEAELAAEAALYEAPPARVDPAFDEEPLYAPKFDSEPALPPRAMDASVLEVLREEAEREVGARRGDPPRMEMQTDLGLTAPTTEANGLGAVARRLARMKGIEQPKPDAKPPTRADAFPAIEEINSTLRASSEKRSGAASVATPSATHAPQQASGFRSGFTLMLILAVLIVLVYVMAPKLAAQFPAAAPMLDSYVAMVDVARVTLDELLKSAIGFLRGLAGKA